MNEADIEYSEIKLCAFLEEGFLLFNSYPLGGLPLGGEFSSVSHWWIPLSGEPFGSVS